MAGLGAASAQWRRTITLDDGVAQTGLEGVVRAGIRVRGDLTAVPGLAGIVRAEIGVRGDLAVALGLGAFDSSGLAVDAVALLEASETGGTLYADPDRGGSDAPLAGELGLGVGETAISRIRWDSSRLRLNGNDHPAPLTLEDYFLAPERRVYVQTLAGGVASFPAADHTSAQAAGGGYVNFSNLPADVVAVLDGIAAGTRFILAVGQESPELGGVARAAIRVRGNVGVSARLAGVARAAIRTRGVVGAATRLAGALRARIRASGTLAYSSPLTGILRAAIRIRGALDSSPRLAGVARAAIRARGILRAELPADALPHR